MFKVRVNQLILMIQKEGESLDDEFAKLEELSLDDELNKYRTQNTQEDKTSDSEVDLELEKYKNK